MDQQPGQQPQKPQKKRRRDTVQWQGNPDWRGMILWYFKGILGTVVILGLMYALREAGVVAIGHIILVGVILIAALGIIGYWKRRLTVYTITRSRLSMKTGIINVRKEQAPLDKINNIIIERTLVERLIGIGEVDIDTANEKVGIMKWWAVRDPYHVERLIDRLRDELSSRSSNSSSSNDQDDDYDILADLDKDIDQD
jgi:uncharacterized membrane protein YdbT with pleckstrin-like domain